MLRRRFLRERGDCFRGKSRVEEGFFKERMGCFREKLRDKEVVF